MQWGKSIIIDSLHGQALIGGVAIPVAYAGQRGELQVGGAAGAVLRPLAFGERTRIAACAAVVSQSIDVLCAGIAAAAVVQPGDTDPAVQEILALALAGADQEAPLFTEAALLVARATGWDFAQLDAADAVTIDRLAVYLAGRPAADESGWNRIVLVDDRGDESLDSIRREMAERLLKRAALLPEDVQENPPLSAANFADREPMAGDSAGNEHIPEFPGLAADMAPAAQPAPADPGRKIAYEGPSSRQGFIRVRSGEMAPGRGRTQPAIPGQREHRLHTVLRQSLASPSSPAQTPLPPTDTTARQQVFPEPGTTITAVQPELLPVWVDTGPVSGASGTAAGYSPRSQPGMGQAASLESLLPDEAAALNRDDRLLDIADTLAALLHEEADLRGIAR